MHSSFTSTFNIPVPGTVSSFTAVSRFPSVQLIWHPPQEPNGYIIAYEVTYSVNDSQLITVNTTNINTNFVIPQLTPGTTSYLSDISVSAYTKVGPGDPTFHANVTSSSENSSEFALL